MTQDQEQQWIRSARSGDAIAYGHLVRVYQDMVFSLAYSLLRHRQDAEDLCQDVFVKVFRTIGQFEGRAPFKGWLYRVTYREGINRIKAVKKHRDIQEIQEGAKEDWVTTRDVVSELDLLDQRMVIQSAMNHLEPLDRFLIMSYYFGDLSIREISEMTSLSESHIKVKLFRCRKQLYHLFQKKLSDEYAGSR